VGHLLGLGHEHAKKDVVVSADGKSRYEYDTMDIMTTHGEGRRPGAKPREEQIKYIVDNFCNAGCAPQGGQTAPAPQNTNGSKKEE
jgi:hypothetical protein